MLCLTPHLTSQSTSNFLLFDILRLHVIFFTMQTTINYFFRAKNIIFSHLRARLTPHSTKDPYSLKTWL